MMHKNSPPKCVLSVCTALHTPLPAADLALTRTLYFVPASSPIRKAEVAGWETVTWLPHEVVPLLLYCTLYWEMGTSLWGAVQYTLRLGLPFLTALDRVTLFTWEGALHIEIWNEADKTPFDDTSTYAYACLHTHNKLHIDICICYGYNMLPSCMMV